MKESKMATPFGEVDLTPTDKYHIYVSGYLMVNGVEYSLSAHYHRWNTGEFQLGQQFKADGTQIFPFEREQGSWYMSRTLNYARGNDRSPSLAAKKKAQDTLLPLVQQWAKDNHVEVLKADLENLEENMLKTQGEIDDKLKELADLRKKLEGIKALRDARYKSLNPEAA